MTRERVLPHNLEAERSVLGAVFAHESLLNLALEVLTPADFYRDAHRRIFDAMIALNERGVAIDYVTVKAELGADVDRVGGPAYIASLGDGMPRAVNVTHYARLVKDQATLRSLIHTANKISADAYAGDEEPDDVLDAAEAAVFAIADRRTRDGFRSMEAVVRDRFQVVERLVEQRRLVTGVPTGFLDLDEMTRGLQKGDLVIVAGRPSMGKTALVLNIAEHVGRQADQLVGLFSLEMSEESLFLRLLSSVAQIDAHRLMGGLLSQRDYARLGDAMEQVAALRLHVDDGSHISVLEMRAKARRLKAELGLTLLVVDYIQLMTARGRFESRTLELASISRALKGLAKELEVPIVVLSQLSRAPEARSDKRPQLSDLRESGALEQDADVVVLIYRDDVYNRDPANPDAGTAELIVAKQRNGPTGTVRLAFLREQTRFMNLAMDR